jgi:hypothetical protein
MKTYVRFWTHPKCKPPNNYQTEYFRQKLPKMTEKPDCVRNIFVPCFFLISRKLNKEEEIKYICCRLKIRGSF